MRRFQATCTRIRFQKDPFSKSSVLGCPHVSYVNPETPFTRTWIDPRKRASTWKSRPLCTDSPRAQIALFCLFPLLASVVLLYCFTCMCPVEGVYVVCESWRQVIKERLQRQNETHTKDEAKWNKNKTTHLRLRRRRGRVASEDNSNHPPFRFRRQLPSKQKEISCHRFLQRDCKCTWSNIHRLGTPFLIALETVAEKIRIPCSHEKKIRIRNLRFRKIHFRERFRKSSVLGAWAFSKSSGYVRIRVTVSMYPGSKRPGYVCTQPQFCSHLDFFN